MVCYGALSINNVFTSIMKTIPNSVLYSSEKGLVAFSKASSSLFEADYKQTLHKL